MEINRSCGRASQETCFVLVLLMTMTKTDIKKQSVPLFAVFPECRLRQKIGPYRHTEKVHPDIFGLFVRFRILFKEILGHEHLLHAHIAFLHCRPIALAQCCCFLFAPLLYDNIICGQFIFYLGGQAVSCKASLAALRLYGYFCDFCFVIIGK